MAMKGVNLSLGATNNGKTAFTEYERALKQIQKQQRNISRSNRSMMRGMSDNRRVIQQVGMQVSDFSVQVAGGQSAVLAFTQNVPQVIQMFGAWGGVLAGLVTVLGTLVFMLTRAGNSFSDIARMLGATQGQINAVTGAFKTLGDVAVTTINMIVNSMDTLWFILKQTAGFVATVWLLKFVTSGKVVLTLSVALIKNFERLKMVIKRFLPAAIVFALVSFIEKIRTLNKELGSWKKTFSLLGGVVAGFFRQFGYWVGYAAMKFMAFNAGFSAAFYKALNSMFAIMPDWANKVIGVFKGLTDSIIELFKALPAVIGSLMIQAANAIIAAVEGALQTVISGMNAFIGAVNYVLPDMADLGYISDVDIGRLENRWKGAGAAAGEAMSDAFETAMGTDYVGENGILTLGAAKAHENAVAAQKAFNDLASDAAEAARAPNEAWNTLTDTLSKANDKAFDIRDTFSKFGEKKDEDKLSSRWKKALTGTAEEFEKFLGRQKFYASKSAFWWGEHIKFLKRRYDAAYKAHIDAAKKSKREMEKTAREMEKIQARMDKLKAVAAEQAVEKAMDVARGPFEFLKKLPGEVGDAVETSSNRVKRFAKEMGKPLEKVWEDAGKGVEAIENAANGITSTMKDSFKGLIRGTKSFKDAMLDILDSIMDRLLDLMLDPFFNSIAGGINKGLGGIFGGGKIGGVPTVPSFSGGGFTGYGVRAGGLDGRGGKLALLHPNETVIDHTKMSGRSSSSGGISIVNNNYFNGVTREEVMTDVAESQRAMKKQIDSEFPGRVQEYQFNRGRGMG